MIDIHSHILWGVDDGPKDLERSLRQLDLAKADNITVLFATSHFKPGLWETMQERFEELKPHAAERGIELVQGCEIDFVHISSNRPLPTMNGGRYILVDMCRPYLEMSCSQVLFQAAMEGYNTIIAHPERLFMASNLKVVKELVEMDCVFQLNASSITGNHGKQCRNIALKLIAGGYAHYVGSDAHSPRRTFMMTQAREIVCREFGADTADILFEENAQRLLNNKEPYQLRPVKKRKWYQFFKKR